MAEASNSFEDALAGMMQEQIAGINTAMPGVIASYENGYASVVPNGQKRFADGESVAFPVVHHVPVCWPAFAGGLAGLKGPVKPGDKCLLVFAQQAIDGSEDMRQHDLSDAYAVLCDPANAGGGNDRLTLFYGGASISIGEGGDIEIVAPGGLTINGVVTQTGGDLTSEGVALASHTHGGVQSGGANTGAPNA